MKKFIVLVAVVLSFAGCEKEDKNLKLRLKWIKQAQFAGYLVANEKGFFKDEGLEVDIQPAGPDIKSFMTVANGSDDIGIAMPNQIISARSNGVPLTIIAQIFQDSPYRYVIKAENKIDSLQQLKGKTVGLWLKNDEAEFTAMLQNKGMTNKDVNIVPQEFTITPFLEDHLFLSQVTVFNELNQIQSRGINVQVLSPKDFNSAFIGDMIFCHQDFLEKEPEKLQKFLKASIKGWKYAISHEKETLDILLKANPTLDREQQRLQLNAVKQLIETGASLTDGIGYMDKNVYSNIERILLNTNQIQSRVDVNLIYSTSILDKLKVEDKKVELIKP